MPRADRERIVVLFALTDIPAASNHERERPPASEPMNLNDLLTRPAASHARALVRQLEEETFAEQLRIVTIPAPSLQEAQRAEFVRKRFDALRLCRAHVDDVGNVLAGLPGASRPELPPVVLSAHLDTVFGPETYLIPRHVGNRVYAPGVTDNARGVAALLTVARVLVESGVRTRAPVWFAGTVGEEGIGDLRGAKHLFRPGGHLARPSAFIALDGSGIRRIVHRAIGARRLRVEITGPGGHSWSDWGAPNPLHALGRGIDRILRLHGPARSKVTLTVARAGGGTTVNAIPATAWLELDLRGEVSGVVAELEQACRRTFQEVVDGENRERRAGSEALKLTVRVIGDRPSGQIPETAPLVSAAVAATRMVGAQPELVASSTDANVPLSLGIPAVALGAGGESGGIHTTEEWFCNREGVLGLERALLTVLSVAGVE